MTKYVLIPQEICRFCNIHICT